MGKRKRKSKAETQGHNFNPYLTKLSYELDRSQLRYDKAIRRTPVVFVDAPAGTGKTTLAIRQGMEHLRKGLVDKLIYIRFVDDRYLKMGFFPGTLEEKEFKLFLPFFDAMEELGVEDEALKVLREQKQLSLTTDTTLRGCNLKNAFVVIDEAQNARKISDFQLILTRVHDERGKVVIIGHSGQQDNKGIELTKQSKLTPFQAFKVHMLEKPFAIECTLENNYRGEISQWADKIQETLVGL